METIEFFDGEDDDLPEPLTRKEIVRLARRMANTAVVDDDVQPEAGTEEVRLDGKTKTGCHNHQLAHNTQVVMDDAEKQMVAEAAAALDAPAQPPPPVHATVVVEDEDQDQPIKIVKNYTRTVCDVVYMVQ